MRVKVSTEPTQATSLQCFDWLKRVAEIAITQEVTMSEAIGLEQMSDVLRLETMKNDLTVAINEATDLLVNLRARAEVLSVMARDLM